MNWVLIFVLLILVLSMFRGYHRGFLRIIYSMVSWIIILVIVSWAAPRIGDYLIRNTTIYETIQSRCEDKIKETAAERTQNQLNQESKELGELGINLPDPVMNKILEKAAGAADGFMEANGIYTEIAGGMAGFVVHGIAFLIALVAASIVVSIISHILGIVSRIPVLKGVNRILGVFAGGVYGFMIVWIAFYVIAICSTSEWGRVLTSYIDQNGFLTYLYKNNLLVSIIMLFL